MKVAYFPYRISHKKSSLIMGSFETIHNGHLELINNAKKTRYEITMMIIEDPSLLPKAKHKNLVDLDTRLQILANIGIDNVIVVKFNEKVKNMEGKKFVNDLVKITNAQKIFIGKDFKIGYQGKYTEKDIAKDYDTKIIDFKKINNQKISTSLISEFLQLGEVDLIKKCSPFYYHIKLHFNAKKEVKNYPFINIHAGIYAAAGIINDIKYWAAIHINQDGILKIYIPDLKIVNKPFDATIFFYKMTRIIVSSQKDKLTNDDKKLVASYLDAL